MTPHVGLVKQESASNDSRDFFSIRISGRQILATVLVLGMFAAGGLRLSAQDVPPPPPDDQSTQPYPPQQGDQQLPQYGAPAGDGSQQPYDPSQSYDSSQQPPMPPQVGQPMSPDQLNQLVAPIALYPDALVAQILAGATYPAQVADANNWRQAQGNAPPEQVASAANAQQWDPSVKALTAFPTVLSQMARNMQWTTDLGNAYYNQPQDVMNAVQQMRNRAQSAGTLESNSQQVVTDDGGDIEIAPANPDVVYVPAYDPWAVYGPSIVAYPGYYYAPPPGFFIGGGAGWGVRFGIGIPLRPWAPWGWGWRTWGVGWRERSIIYNRNTYITRSNTVINRGFNRPGAPPRMLSGSRGSFINRPGYAGYANRGGQGGRPGNFNDNRQIRNSGGGFGQNRPGNFGNRPVYRNPGQQQPGNGGFNGNNNNRVQPTGPRPGYNGGQNYGRPGNDAYRPSAPQNNNRPAPSYNRPEQQPNRPMAAPRTAPAPRMSAPPPMSAPRGGGEGGGGRRR